MILQWCKEKNDIRRRSREQERIKWIFLCCLVSGEVHCGKPEHICSVHCVHFIEMWCSCSYTHALRSETEWIDSKWAESFVTQFEISEKEEEQKIQWFKFVYYSRTFVVVLCAIKTIWIEIATLLLSFDIFCDVHVLLYIHILYGIKCH